MIHTKMWTLYLTATILSVIQIHSAAGCTITSVTSPSAATLNVAWNPFSGATSYQLELRVIDSTTIAPVVVTVTSPTVQKLVQGLRPGHHYEVTLKPLKFFTVASTCKSIGMTVPGTVQITTATALSSSSIKLEWTSVTGAENYTVHVEQLFVPTNTFSHVFTTLSGQVLQLSPSTTYMCYIIATNTAGNGAKGSTRTVTTLVPPPNDVNVTSTGKSTAIITWKARNGVIVYEVTVADTDPLHSPQVERTSGTSLEISHLDPCSNYTVGVSSLDSFLVPGEPNKVSHITSDIYPVSTVTYQYNCTTATVTVMWVQVFGANSYKAAVTDGTGESLNCTSVSTSCDISGLKCGETYTVYVTAISDDCSSTYTLPNKFETVPCAPANPLIEYTCSGSVITYKWTKTNNTLYYVAKSTNKAGQAQECRTQSSMCYFTNVGCGETYTFTVQAISQECNSEVTEQKTIETAPCFPQNIQTLSECTDKLTTTWDAATGAQYYTVSILGNIQNYNCTTQNTSCEIEEVPCGEHLSVTVTASNAQCTTPEVLGEVAQTAPCTPINVSASYNCSQDKTTVNWIPSNGVVYYIVIAEDSSGRKIINFTLDSEYDFDSLQCGETYNVSVIGTNMICNSSASASAPFPTASCPPTNVVAERNCTTNQASITWDNHQATGSYTAVIEDDQSGDTFNCTSNTVNSCIISSPPCGKTYSVTVIYNNGDCSATSTAVSMDSVPCQPENVAANVTCITGELTVTWTSPVPAQEYITEISGGTPSQTLYCNSTETKCIQAGLDCGSDYTLAVYSLNGSCSSLPSSPLTVQTIPCAPASVTVEKACLSNHSSVSWTTSAGATKYIAEAVSADGSTSTCDSLQTSCSFSDLHCGQVYTISVSGVDDTCAGPQSSTVSLWTEPCSPVNVTSQIDCQANTAVVSWAASANAANYSVKATNTGSSVSCHGANTSCTLHYVDCNVRHTITVTASDEMCTSNMSAPFEQSPVPCAPQNVQTSLACSTNDVVVSWTEVNVNWDYNVTAVSSSGQAADASCTTGFSNCTLNGLECGQNYTVTVIAFSGSCVGPTSIPVTVTAAPCAVADLTTDLTCGSNTLNVSMSAASGAPAYIVTVSGPNGFSKNCTGTSLCQITGLQCATEYNISAVTEGSPCNSPPTNAVVTTGPCDPTNVHSALICSSDSATVSWDTAQGAAGYTVKASEVGSQYEISCRNKTPFCQLDRLNCGKNYTLTIMSEGTTCNSTGTIASLTTAPCSPTIQYYNLTCGTNSSSLTWTSVQGATGYIVNAETANGDSVSCNSTTSECILTDLKCSQNYTATVIALGNECDSEPSTSFTIGTAPCPPSITSQYMCSSNSDSISWSDPGGSTGFYAEVIGNHTDSCDTTNTSCEFQKFPCGLILRIKVRAKGPQCDSEDSIGESFETVPCAPENVSATLICDHDSAIVTWTESSLAVNYTVTATDQTSVSHCHNVSTSCMLQGLQCGVDYNITVTSHSATCTGFTSDVHTFKAGLCAPTSASVSTECQNSTVKWSNVPGAEKVVATATSDNGQTYTCESNSSHSCSFSDIPCGGNYSVSVLTVDRGCNSVSKSAGQLVTVQCPPSNLDGNIDCRTNAVTLTWDQSSVPGINYSIKSELIGSGAAPDVFTSSTNTYTINNLQCGEIYNFSVAANEGNCLTSYGPPIQISTAPCEPTSFTAHVDCGSNNGTFSWTEGKGASSYTVMVTGEHGNEANCSSNHMTCVVKLDCGIFYSATLVAFTDTCSTNKSAKRVIESAPCLPENVEGVVDCSTNVMNVTWKEMPTPENYTAWAISTDGHNASCTSESNSCSISDLECGRVYDVVVSASSIDCKVIAGSDYKVQSAPCKPENMTVDLNCSANAVIVSWTQPSTNHNNTVTATSDSGVSTCQTENTSCSFLNLNCGTHYTFTAVAQTNVCRSENSTKDKTTAPCAPTAVSAKLNCETKEAVVTWNSTGSVESFSVQAQSSDGHISSCTDTNTTCNLQQLLCGEEYTVSVEAVNADCTGPPSTSTFVTEPCVPVNLTATYTVGIAQVTWGATKGASSYSVEAVADQSAPTISNTTTSTQYVLTGLLCGKTYNITATAHNEACDSGVTSEQIELTTEPCPPTNVQANMQCDQHSAIVSWNLSDNAVGYTVFFQNENSHNTSCEATSSQSSCEASGLECGTVYAVYAVAKGNPIDSSPSIETSVTTDPCQPSNINVTVDCEAKTATVSWQASDGAQSYVTELRSSNHSDICVSNTTSCQPSHLHCGEEYNVSVTAVGESCNTTGHMAPNFYTEPCEATDVSINYTVGNSLVYWNAGQGATSYSVAAVSDQGALSVCNSNSTQCTVSGLQCSKLYNVTVSAHNQVCNSLGVTSETMHFTTEPCPPSNIQATVACQQLEATISWNQSTFAVGYVAYINNTEGHSSQCDAGRTDTSCVISGLVCDLVYSAWVIAKGQQYNSSESTVISFVSAPCSPKDIQVQVNCSSDGGATVSWTAPVAANFSVTSAVSGNPQNLCETQQNSCVVSGLSCGQTYNLNITATNEQCSVTAPTHPSINTRPCPLTGVSTSHDCLSGIVTVNWLNSTGADDYTATLTSGSGLSENCTSQSTTCSVSGLDCGQNFTVSVTASNAECTITSTEQINQTTAPCVPTNIDAVMNCTTDSATVSWSPSSGAENYTVSGQSATNNVSCETSGLTCALTNLPCGTQYTIFVVARDSTCSSAPSQTMTLDTAPCPPENVDAVSDCATNSLTVSWTSSAQAQYYLVSATAQNGGSNETCNTTNSACNLTSVSCGNTFVVQVTAVRGSCQSQPSQTASVVSKPCRPNAPVVDDSCGDAQISWTVSPVADMYHVVAVGDNGHTHTCNTTFDNCTLSPLHCEQQYSVYVIAMHEKCSSLDSPNVTLNTGPCKPDNVFVTYDCHESSALLTWNERSNAVHYYASAVDDNDSKLYCQSNYNNCTFEDLQCGKMYNFTVLATDGTCNSSYSDPVDSVGAVPCPPEDVAVQLLPQQNNEQVLSLSWSASNCNNTEYLVRLTGNLMGNSEFQFDISSYWTLDTYFELLLPCGSEYNATVVTRNSAGTSSPSDTVTGTTVN